MVECWSEEAQACSIIRGDFAVIKQKIYSVGDLRKTTKIQPGLLYAVPSCCHRFMGNREAVHDFVVSEQGRNLVESTHLYVTVLLPVYIYIYLQS